MEISGELRRLLDRGLLPLERLFGDALMLADMVMATKHHRCVSELVTHARGDHRLHGLAEGSNRQATVGVAVGKVMHQVQPLKGKWHGRRQQAAPLPSLAETDDADTSADQGPRRE